MVAAFASLLLFRPATQGELLLKRGLASVISSSLDSRLTNYSHQSLLNLISRRLSLVEHHSRRKFSWSYRKLSMSSSSVFGDEGEKPQVVFVLGGPGAGKGTQCAKIVSTYGFTHLSAGDLLREERNKPDSQYGDLIEKHITGGTIVPVAITCSLIERAIFNSNPSKWFLVDGFPRNQDNVDGWEKQMSGKVDLLFVLFFDVSEEICIERCLSRGEGGSGRSDDNLEVLKKRIATYNADSLPIIHHYIKRNLVRRIDSSKSVDEVFIQVQKWFDNFLKLKDKTSSVS